MNIKKYILPVAVAAMMASCSEDPVLPPIYAPVATIEANTSIIEVKQQYWQNDKNYIAEIGTKENGDHIIVSGRVTGVDVSGNIFKYLYIEDETAALGFSIDASKLNETYKIGQELVVDLTEMNIGKWNTELLVGKPEWYEAGQAWEAGRMELATFQQHVEINGMPDPAALHPETLALGDFCGDKNATKDALITYGHMLVTFENVHLKYSGKAFNEVGSPYTTSSSGDINTYINYLVDSEGNELMLPISAYADFLRETAPAGVGSVTGILCYKYQGYDRKSQWGLYVVDYAGFKDFDGTTPDTPDSPDTPVTPGEGNGTQDAPYTVAQVIALGNPGTTGQWVSGYIVGVLNYDNNSNLETGVPTTVNTCIAIAATPDETDKANCVAVKLAVGDFRSALNLVDNPGNLGKEVKLQGTLAKYFGMAGLTDLTAGEIDGKPIGEAPATPGDGDTWTRATSITSGSAYVLWTDDFVSKPMTYSADKPFGWLSVNALRLNADGTLTTSADNAYTFTAVEGGYTIQDSNGTYLYMDASHDSFQLSPTFDASEPTLVWTVTPASDGRFEIVNAGNYKMVQLSLQYKSYGAYANRTTGSQPYLYQK